MLEMTDLGFGICYWREGGKIAIVCDHEEPTWIVYTGLSHKPAPTIILEGTAWAITGSERTSDGWVYRLGPWPDHVRILRRIELTPEALAEQAGESRRERRYANSWKWRLALDLATGLLPARIQESISLRYASSPERASMMTAFLMILVGSLTVFGILPLGGYFVGWLLVAESLIRLMYAITHMGAIGWIPLEALDRVLVLLGIGPTSDDTGG